MQYDLLHLPGVTPPGCGQTYISPEMPDGHERGDRLQISCFRCGGYGEHEVRGVLRGLV